MCKTEKFNIFLYPLSMYQTFKGQTLHINWLWLTVMCPALMTARTDDVSPHVAFCPACGCEWSALCGPCRCAPLVPWCSFWPGVCGRREHPRNDDLVKKKRKREEEEGWNMNMEDYSPTGMTFSLKCLQTVNSKQKKKHKQFNQHDI